MSGVEIVIGTPGRLADLLASGVTTLSRVTMAIVDEADQVLFAKCGWGWMPEGISQVSGDIG